MPAHQCQRNCSLILPGEGLQFAADDGLRTYGLVLTGRVAVEHQHACRKVGNMFFPIRAFALISRARFASTTPGHRPAAGSWN